ncbi:MAG: response regulator [Thermoguttaceae bacterium]|jgi:two-component system phosphate regulon response regulator PhoB|nr:response regulator [Thermoguttaceae bacterium]
MAGQDILVVEDEKDIQELVRYNLAKEGYSIRCVATGEEALRAVRSSVPDLVILDLMLPGISGLDVCRSIKGDPATRHVSVVMLTAKGEEADVVSGLELGADDYVPKPFSPRVLLARIRAVLRRAAPGQAPPAEKPIKIRDLSIHPGRYEVLRGGKPVSLSPTEFRVLHFLAGRPGWVFTRYQIADAIHGGEDVVTDRSIDVQIAGLRKKLGSAGAYLETVRGVGYRFKQ